MAKTMRWTERSRKREVEVEDAKFCGCSLALQAIKQVFVKGDDCVTVLRDGDLPYSRIMDIAASADASFLAPAGRGAKKFKLSLGVRYPWVRFLPGRDLLVHASHTGAAYGALLDLGFVEEVGR